MTRTTTATGAAATDGPGDRLPWPALLVLSAAAFATVSTELLPASLLPEISAGLGVRPASAGLLVSAWALTIAVTSVPLVRATGRLPRGGLLAAALAVLAVATAVTAAAPTYPVALVARVVAATAHGLFWSLLAATAASLSPPARAGRAVSVVLAGPALAGAVGIPLAAAISTVGGWRTAFAALAALLAAAAVAVRSAVGPPPDQAAPAPAGRDPAGAAVLGLAVAGGLVLTGHFALYTYVALLLRDVAGADAPQRALLLLVFGVAGVAGIALAGPLSDRWPRHSLTVVVAGFAATAGSLGLLGAHPALAVLGVAAWGLLTGVLPPVWMTRLLRAASAGRQASAGALGVSALNLGIAAGAAAGGLLLGTWEVSVLPPVSATVIGLVAVGLLLVPRRRRLPEAAVRPGRIPTAP